MELKLEQVKAGDGDAFLGLLRRPVPAAVQTIPDLRQKLIDQMEGFFADVQHEGDPFVQRRPISARSGPNESLLWAAHDT